MCRAQLVLVRTSFSCATECVDIDHDPCAAGANCVAIEKCTEATRKKLKILDSDPSYKVHAKLDTSGVLNRPLWDPSRLRHLAVDTLRGDQFPANEVRRSNMTR